MRKNILISLLTLLLLNVQLLASGVDWTVNVHNYQYDMTAYVTLRLNGADVADLSSYTIAAFCNDECRGVMEARSVDNNAYGYLRIRSNQFSGEIITFKVYDPVSDRIAISTNQITFQSQQVIGYPSSPFVVEAMFQNWEPEFITICYGDSFAWDKSGKTYTESGVYTTIYDNAQATLHLTVLPEVPTTTEYATICHGETYTWNGQTYSTEGEYSVTLQNALGCDSIVTLHLTVNQTKYAEEHITACDSYTWNGETYTTSGDYVYTTTASNGCDSIVTLHLTINHSEVSAPEYATICHGETYTWNGQTYSTEGEYSVTLQNVLGCDSIVTLHLTVNQTKYAEEIIIACDSYTWNGETYTESGDYVYTTTATNGCDSIVTLHLTINQTKHAEETITACDSYTWNGETYTESGDYTYTTTASNGCDSIVTLHLIINPTKYAEETITTCDSYTWNGETYTESGDYVYTTTADNGCDSIVTLHLTINHSEVAAPEYATICHGETYTWNGQTYSTEGEYSVTLQNALGCDSVAILHLTIMPAAITTTETVVIGSDELPYTWRGNTYSATGRYTDIEQYATIACDSAIHVLDLTVLNTDNYDEQSVTICDTEAPYLWYGESYSATGKYTYTEKYVGTDIDSIQHILNLTVNPTVYTEEHITACDSYAWNGETYTESGDYVYTIIASNGCDSIVTLHLTINHTEVSAPEYATICHGETYTWNGQTYSTEGEYSVTLQNALGCDSVATLHLTITPEAVTTTETVVIGSDELPYTWRGNTYTATGRYTDIEQYATIACDSAIYVLDLTVLNTDNYDEQSVTICDTEAPYQWYGESYSATGKYTYTEKYVGTDIDSIQHILNLTVNPTKHAEETITACDSYTWNGETYTTSGDYVYTTTAANGCDSIVTLHLTINQTKYAEDSITACDSHTWNGETYTESGDYVYTTTASTGCDSIVTLHLTINQTQYAEESVTACDSYTWNGETYTESSDYVYTTTAANGCDSIVTLHLTINETQYAEESITACDSYAWNGETYTTSGEYVYTTTATNGCDSIVTLHLTINETQYTEETVVACDSYTWNGVTYTESGDYVYTTAAANGCDSIVTLHLTINQTKYAEESITACDSYTWNGETYTESGDYVYTTTATNGCDSIVTLHLTLNKSEYVEKTVTTCDSYEWNGLRYTESGDYTYTTTTDYGCDRVEVLHLTILEVITETEILALCPSELPYEWYGQSLTEAGLYTATEQYSGMSCDSIIHELTLNIFVQTLPDQLTLPIVQPGKPIDVTIPTEEIMAYIAAQTWYAPNAWVVWYVKDGAEWGPLTTEPVSSAASNVVLKYAVETDCDIVESPAMTIIIEPTSVDLIQSVEKSTHKIICNDKVWIIRNGEMYNIVGVKVTEVR